MILNKRLLFPSAAFVLLFPMPALPWGAEGHEAIGAAAESWLSRKGYSSAQRRVRQILLPGETLRSVSTWADRIKQGTAFPGDADSAQFLKDQRNLEPTVEDGKPRHFGFHYTDRPFQAASYEPRGIGARPDDIVGMINACVDSLRRAGARDTRFSPRVALILLTHYVGDLHQPLHVGSGYIADQGGGKWRFVYPTASNKAICDEGGNKIWFKYKGSSLRLHRYWDENAVLLAMGAQSVEQLATRLASSPVQPGWKAPGPSRNWARAWATDTLSASKQMYAPVRIISLRGEGPDREWTIAFEGGNGAYSQMAGKLAEKQMAKSAFRLAEVLRAIWP